MPSQVRELSRMIVLVSPELLRTKPGSWRDVAKGTDVFGDAPKNAVGATKRGGLCSEKGTFLAGRGPDLCAGFVLVRGLCSNLRGCFLCWNSLCSCHDSGWQDNRPKVRRLQAEGGLMEGLIDRRSDF